jgi:hypothetical protein
MGRLGLAAAAALSICAAMTPAAAAGLPGGCCSDLEARVAELEATAASSGNRVVSLHLYGQVNKGLLIWDDGTSSDAFVVDNSVESSRFGLTGAARIEPGWIAGYTIEFELRDARADEVFNGPSGDDPEGSDSPLKLRQNNLYIESERFGRITIGYGVAAADGVGEIVIGHSGTSSDAGIGGGLAPAVLVTRDPLTLTNSWAGSLNPDRGDLIRYDMPSILGFVLSASWGDNDYADVALRFRNEFGAFRVDAALAYIWDNTADPTPIARNYQQAGGSVSVMHVPTGLYAAFQAAARNYEESGGGAPSLPDPHFWYVQAGIERKWLPYGATTIYGEFGDYRDFLPTGSETARWGGGINQQIDAAAMEVYVQAATYSMEAAGGIKYDDLTTVFIGSRIQF